MVNAEPANGRTCGALGSSGVEARDGEMSEEIYIPLPDESLHELGDLFIPDAALNEFVEASFLDEQSPLFNLDHIHLTQARIGFLWTNTVNRRKMKRVVGEAEMPNFKGGAWQKARQEQQLIEWFGLVPDFVITLSAGFRFECEDVEFLALLEHELYHCGQRVDEFGFPKFSKSDGKPIFGMRGHDVEEFIGVVRRYGIGAVGQDAVDFIAAGMSEPSIAPAKISALCGTCV